MIEYVIDKRNSINETNPDNIYSALGDQLVLGKQIGFRRKERGQDRAYLKKYRYI